MTDSVQSYTLFGCYHKIVFTLLVCCAGQQARAVFNAKAISGYIQFTTVTGGVRIQTHLEGLAGMPVG